ncbi:MAG: formylglycine-generating enzyme family protein [Pirellulaceae bacterium]
MRFPSLLADCYRFSLLAASIFLIATTDVPGQDSPKTVTNSIGITLVAVSPGTFEMVSPVDEEGADNDELQHRVTIGKGFHLGAHEVTQAQFQKVMGENPSYFQKRAIRKADTGDHPVENVSWHQADQFCKRLSELPEEKSAGRTYRLPTEAEWEFACRAGTTSPYSCGADKAQLLDYAWFADNGKNLTHPVGSKKPNPLGLFDMHGNVWEWCQDWYANYPDPTPEGYAGPERGERKVFRGGGVGLWSRLLSIGSKKFRSAGANRGIYRVSSGDGTVILALRIQPL